MAGDLSREGGDRYAGKRMVIAALVESIKTGRTDKFFRDATGLGERVAVSDRVRGAVARREAEKIYSAVTKVFLDAVVNGDGLRLDGFGRIFLKQGESEKEVEWLDGDGNACAENASNGETQMYRLERGKAGWYAFAQPHSPDASAWELKAAGFVSAGWVLSSLQKVKNKMDGVMYGPIADRDTFVDWRGVRSAFVPWSDGSKTMIDVVWERRIAGYGPGAKNSEVWVYDDIARGETSFVNVRYEVSGSLRLHVTK